MEDLKEIWLEKNGPDTMKENLHSREIAVIFRGCDDILENSLSRKHKSFFHGILPLGDMAENLKLNSKL